MITLSSAGAASLLALLLCGCASAEKTLPNVTPEEPPMTTKAASFDSIRPRKIAIITSGNQRGNLFPSSVNQEREANIYEMIEDYFTESLLSKGYTVASRTDVGHLLKEIGFQNSGLTESD